MSDKREPGDLRGWPTESMAAAMEDDPEPTPIDLEVEAAPPVNLEALAADYTDWIHDGEPEPDVFLAQSLIAAYPDIVIELRASRTRIQELTGALETATHREHDRAKHPAGHWTTCELAPCKEFGVILARPKENLSE